MSIESVAFLDRLTAAAEQAWLLLFQLSNADPNNWCLLGGQMMYLLASEAGRTLPRTTEDVDVVVDVRARPRGTEWLANWLQQNGLELEGISAERIGHRFVREAHPGPGRIVFDVLAPEGLGSRTKLYTVKPARTVEAPGTKQALNRAQLVNIKIANLNGSRHTVGQVRRPPVTSALVCKAAAATIATRANPETDWQDAALALSMIPNPREALREYEKKDIKRLGCLRRLLDPGDAAWRTLREEERDQGVAALEFLLSE